MTLKKEGDKAGARLKLEEVIAASPDYAPAYHNLGMLLIEEDELEQAIQALQKGAELMPNEPNAHYILATAYARYGEYDKAKPEYLRTLELNPKMMQAHHELALLCFRRGQWQEAIDHFEMALKLVPNSANTMLALGMSYAKGDKPEKAIEMVMQLRSMGEETKASSLERFMRAVQESELREEARKAAEVEQSLLDPAVPGAKAGARKPARPASPFARPQGPPPSGPKISVTGKAQVNLKGTDQSQST